jgi:hypothetical protein
VIRPGQAWGRAASGPAVAVGAGGDADLARLVAANPGARLAFRPDDRCDLARAVGLLPAAPAVTELPMDALDLGDAGLAVNVVVLGRPPDRLRRTDRSRALTVRVDDRLVFDGAALSVVLANGQFWRGIDLVARGHPGDGRLEVQVYAPTAGERVAMRRRVTAGTHLPHPRIVTARGRRADVRFSIPVAFEVDGVPAPPRAALAATVREGAFLLLV